MKRPCFPFLLTFIGVASMSAASIVKGQRAESAHQVLGWLLAFAVAHAWDALCYFTLAVPLLAIDAIAGPCHLLPALLSLSHCIIRSGCLDEAEPFSTTSNEHKTQESGTSLAQPHRAV